MPIRERIDILRLKTGQVISEDWFDELADVLDDIANSGAVTYDGYVLKSLIPYKSNVIDLGSPDFEFDDIFVSDVQAKNVYADYVSAKDVNVSNNVSANYVSAKDVNVSNKTTIKYLDVFEGISTKELNVDEKAYVDEIFARLANVDENLNVYRYVYAYVGDFYEINVDFLNVMYEINVPDYSIGFIKLDPRVVSNPVRTITILAGSTILVPRGIYYLHIPDTYIGNIFVEANFNGVWKTVLDRNGLVVSDGVNVRLSNTATVDVTVELLQIR